MKDDSEITLVFDDGVSDRRCISRRLATTPFVAGSISGRLVDVSEKGLGLEAKRPLPVLLRTHVTLEIPNVRPTFRAEVRWCRLTDTVQKGEAGVVPVYRAGVALLDS